MPVPTVLSRNKISPYIVMTNSCYIIQSYLFIVFIRHLDVLTVTIYDVCRRYSCKSRNPPTFAKTSNFIIQTPSTKLFRIFTVPFLRNIRRFSALTGCSFMQRPLFLAKLFNPEALFRIFLNRLSASYGNSIVLTYSPRLKPGAFRRFSVTDNLSFLLL